MDINWMQFKSGSDIRGVATDSLDGQKITLTNEVVEKITLGFVTWLKEYCNLDINNITVSVGNDPRVSATRIKTVVINALRCVGVQVYDCMLSSTPAMFLTTSTLSCTGAIQITASHHPANRNGLKFFTADGGLSSDDISQILDIASRGVFPPISKYGKVRQINTMRQYCERLRNVICNGIKSKENHNKPLSGFKIAVDAGNGAGGFFANDVLKPLGADISGSIFLEPDGTFPNHIPNPENKEAMEFISKAVVDSNSDIGIIFDTDVDRAAIVDSKGKFINRNKLIALASAIVADESKNPIIVTDSVTSDYLKSFIANLGGKQFRFKRGYKNVIEAAKKFNNSGLNCPLAIETSGHAAFKENNFLDDGAFLAAKIIIKMVKMRQEGKSIESLVDSLNEAKESTEIRIPINHSEILSTSNKLFDKLKAHVKTIKSCSIDEDNVEGLRIKFNARWQEGWCLLRVSVHDPVLVLNVECYVHNGVHSVLLALKPFFENYSFLDLSSYNQQLTNTKN